jgi:hypothetical protein
MTAPKEFKSPEVWPSHTVDRFGTASAEIIARQLVFKARVPPETVKVERHTFEYVMGLVFDFTQPFMVQTDLRKTGRLSHSGF